MEDKKDDKKIKMNTNYLLMDSNELVKNGITGRRLRIAEFLQTKIYDIFVIILIILYTLLIFVYFALDGTDIKEDQYKITLYIIEIVILAFFVIDITLHVSAFFTLYLRDCWNIFDLIVIILSILFVVLDFKVKNKVV